ncbi:Alpha/Beta hydrolase protein [Hygrophoropsis aurantiaca]|uniref:Alpha/Beta hydrolase protein n=1 Tax=Hygrophoropsis aurantiaca TaxID=72124 RepID=A0ACB8A8W7_9AGAM|nr:Alpha/Beta hydrolase protein [Hygrophoropsis aurantiaca]
MITSLFVLLPFLFASYFLASFPQSPVNVVHPSLASLPSTSPSWDIYPDDFYPGGAYASLPHGKVRYWFLGPEDGHKVVLIHGLSIPSIIWKDVAPLLATKGYRVLLYDLYGRGYSDAPHVKYDVLLHTTQLALLMQHVNWNGADIVGVSMGGGIATAFSHHFPSLVNGKVALIAPAGIIELNDISRTAKFMSSPFVQTLSALPPFQHYIRHLANPSESSPPNPILEIVRLQSAHLPYYNAAVASCLRDGPIRGLQTSFEALSESGNEVLLIHGTADRTVPYKYASKIRSIIPHAALVTIMDGGHDITVTHEDEVSGALLKFLGDSKLNIQ